MSPTAFLRDIEAECRRRRIPTKHLPQLNKGRAFFTTPETLGDYVLVDFLESRRQMSRAGRGRRAG